MKFLGLHRGFGSLSQSPCLQSARTRPRQWPRSQEEIFNTMNKLYHKFFFVHAKFPNSFNHGQKNKKTKKRTDLSQRQDYKKTMSISKSFKKSVRGTVHRETNSKWHGVTIPLQTGGQGHPTPRFTPTPPLNSTHTHSNPHKNAIRTTAS